MSVYHQVFDSLWNYHLFNSDDADKAVMAAFNALPKNRVPFEGLTDKAHSATASIKRMLSVLHQPEGWRQIKWPENQFSAEDFVRGKGGR
jgi:hypothetical protein